MAKLRPAGKGKPAPKTRATWTTAVSCLIVVVGGVALLGLLFFQVFRGN